MVEITSPQSRWKLPFADVFAISAALLILLSVRFNIVLLLCDSLFGYFTAIPFFGVVLYFCCAELQSMLVLSNIY